MVTDIKEKSKFEITLESIKNKFKRDNAFNDDEEFKELVKKLGEDLIGDEKKINLGNIMELDFDTSSHYKNISQRIIDILKGLINSKKLTNLEELDLSSNHISNYFLSNLKSSEICLGFLKSLKRLNLGKNYFMIEVKAARAEFFGSIKDNIEVLDISYIGDLDAEKINMVIKQLMKFPKLIKLNFSGEGSCNYSSNEYPEFFELISDKIIELDISKFSVIPSSLTQNNLNRIFNVIEKNSSLQKFKISNIKLTEGSLEDYLKEKLKFNYTLLNLDIGKQEFNTDKILERNQIFFLKSRDLFVKKNGSFLGQEIKKMQLEIKKITKTNLEKTGLIMDLVITEILKLKIFNLEADQIMQKIFEQEEKITLDNNEKERLKRIFKKTCDHLKEIQQLAIPMQVKRSIISEEHSGETKKLKISDPKPSQDPVISTSLNLQDLKKDAKLTKGDL
jgi:hypothetical protein